MRESNIFQKPTMGMLPSESCVEYLAEMHERREKAEKEAKRVTSIARVFYEDLPDRRESSQSLFAKALSEESSLKLCTVAEARGQFPSFELFDKHEETEEVMVVPLIDETGLTSLSFVDTTGKMYFLPFGRVDGAFWRSSVTAQKIEPDTQILLCVSVLTAIAAAACSRKPEKCTALATMTKGNLEISALKFKQLYPGNRIRILHEKCTEGTDELIANQLALSCLRPKFDEKAIEWFKEKHKGHVPEQWTDFWEVENDVEFSNVKSA